MKVLISHILTLLMALLAAVSCGGVFDSNTDITSAEGAIVLNFGTSEISAKGTVPDNTFEASVRHLDVIIYEYEGMQNGDEIYTPFYHERINVSASQQGKATLNKTPKDFTKGKEYKFFIIANTTEPAEIYYKDGKILNYKDFLKLDQTDRFIHLAGLDFGAENHTYPQTFLMDGTAYLGESEPDSPARITINSNGDDNDVELNVVLRRAAAKILISIYPGDKVTFTKELLNLSDGYLIRNMPVRSTLVAEGGYPLNDGGQNPYWESTSMAQSPYFKTATVTDSEGKTHEGLQLTAYCYSHQWNKDQVFERGTSMVMMIPMRYQESDESEPIEYINNYYQLSISKNLTIKRNTFYDLRINLNAPGAEDYTRPEDINNIEYFTAPWEKENLPVSGESKVKYLKVNKDKLYMYNISDDENSLYFSSSSPITVTLVSKSAYYYNKYNNKISLADNKVDIKASTQSGAISGNIHVHSDIPTNYTVRYFQLKITNEEGMTEYVDVEQYPLIYIRNNLPWYSYRDDYYYRTTGNHKWDGNISTATTSGDLPTTYEYDGDHVVSVKTINEVNTTTKTVKYTYTSAYSDHTAKTGFTVSKVRGNKQTNGEKYAIDYYYFTYSSRDKKWTKSTYNCETHNVRNYHVRVMASSGEYTVGRPELDEYGYTAGNADNAKLVSPSFVIASRLGAVLAPYSGLSSMTNDKRLIAFADHCKNYVEVDDVNDDKKAPVKVYDNWRLPTEAELKIIMKIQGTDGKDADAIDFLLNGGYYMSASGPVFNDKNTDSTTELADPMQAKEVAIRCVRDHFN